MHSLLYIVLALLGLTFLVLIHELGHYIVAKRQGMKIETFSIGFGKPFVSWMRKGVKWQICFILVGGYVKIAANSAPGKHPGARTFPKSAICCSQRGVTRLFDVGRTCPRNKGSCGHLKGVLIPQLMSITSGTAV